jgi:hypothetical protein
MFRTPNGVCRLDNRCSIFSILSVKNVINIPAIRQGVFSFAFLHLCFPKFYQKVPSEAPITWQKIFALLLFISSRVRVLDWMIEFISTSTTITTHYNSSHQWLSKTRSITYRTTSIFSSAVTDLVLIYELVTFSASVVLWLGLHSWKLNFWILLRLNYDSLMNAEWLNSPELNKLPGEPNISHHVLQLPCYSLSVCCHGNVLTESLPSNGLFRGYSLQRDYAYRTVG